MSGDANPGAEKNYLALWKNGIILTAVHESSFLEGVRDLETRHGSPLVKARRVDTLP